MRESPRDATWSARRFACMVLRSGGGQWTSTLCASNASGAPGGVSMSRMRVAAALSTPVEEAIKEPEEEPLEEKG